MKLSTLRIGAGTKPTLLLHGFLGSGKNLRAVAQRWSERDPNRTFLLPDLAGHGESPPVSEAASLFELATDVLETADSEGLQRPFEIVGHSLGGRVGLAASLVEPRALSRVVFLDITPGPIDSETAESARVLAVLLDAPRDAPERRVLRSFLLDNGLSAPIADWLMMNVLSTGGAFRWRFDRAALARLHARVNAEDLWAAIESRGTRVRCIRGANSPYVPPADVQRMKAAGCPVDSIEGAGHFIHVDALDPLVELLSAN